MAVTREEIIEALKEMTLLEASELVKDIEETFGVSAAAPVAVAAAPAAAAPCRAAPMPLPVVLRKPRRKRFPRVGLLAGHDPDRGREKRPRAIGRVCKLREHPR